MTNPIHYQNQSVPSYSGVTINITNPTLNAAPLNSNCPPNCYNCPPLQPNFQIQQQPLRMNNYASQPQLQPTDILGQNTQQVAPQEFSPINPMLAVPQNGNFIPNNYATSQYSPEKKEQQTYPPQYYLNNYNYIQNGEKGNFQTPMPAINQPIEKGFTTNDAINSSYNIIPQEEDMSLSQNIKQDLDARLTEQKELEKNGTKTEVVALTNEYIMSLENYLNNPNTEIRLMASKEILTRLDEDKDRRDDAALNALLNKMLQDPEKLIRIAALSAFSSQLASGNEFTFELLNNIQNDPNADKEDVVQAADCLLKMSSTTETKMTPAEKQLSQQEQIEPQVK